MREMRLLSLTGFLGDGYDLEAFERGLARAPDCIAVDAGSSDPGPYYLGTSTPLFARPVLKADLGPLLTAARARRIPLIVGTATTAGTGGLVDQAVAILREIAGEHGLRFRLAVIKADVDRAMLRERVTREEIPGLGMPRPLSAADVDACQAIVAQMGPEPIMRALDLGADVVVAGRACDDGLFAAPAIRAGFDRGLALHLGKILECASLCAVPADLRGPMLGTIRADHFLVEPADPKRVCTVTSVAAHTLYERDDPYLQPGPGGTNDLSRSRYEQADPRTVKVSGSAFVPDPVYRVKLEGACPAGYRTIVIAGIRDPILIGQLDPVLARVRDAVRERFGPDGEGRYRLFFRAYGRDAVMGVREPGRDDPREVGILIEAIAPTQEMANAVCGYARGNLQHVYYDGEVATAGNLAYPFSPFTVPAGPVYRFGIYHLLTLRDPCELFPIALEEVGA